VEVLQWFLLVSCVVNMSIVFSVTELLGSKCCQFQAWNGQRSHCCGVLLAVLDGVYWGCVYCSGVCGLICS
jgi:hypothetical protein